MNHLLKNLSTRTELVNKKINHSKPYRCISFFHLLPMFMFSLFFACNEVDHIQPNSAVESRRAAKVEPPLSIEDRLHFSDWQHFEDYFMSLDALIETDLESFDSLVLLSPVRTLHHNTINETFTDPREAFSTFLGDPVMVAIVNEHYEFQIENTLVTYMNDNEILTSDADNKSIKPRIRAIVKGGPLNISNIPEGAFWAPDSDLKAAIKLFCGASISIFNSDCNEVKIVGHCNGFFGKKGKGNVEVVFDPDGPNPQFTLLKEEVTGNFEFAVNLDPFTQDGFVIATVHPDCPFADSRSVTLFIDVSEVLGSCDLSERLVQEDVVNGNEMMRLETSKYTNWVADYCKASIRSFTNKNGSWSQSRARLNVEIDANRNSIFCNFLDNKNDREKCNNCRKKITRVSWGRNSTAFCESDVTGVYRKRTGSTDLVKNQNIDFECCE